MSKKPIRNIADYQQWSAKRQCRSSFPAAPNEERRQAVNKAYATRDGAIHTVTNLREYAERQRQFHIQQQLAYTDWVLSTLGRD